MPLPKEVLEVSANRKVAIATSRRPEIERTLFFLHGFGGCAEQWNAIIDFFVDDYNIIAPDWLGHGDSDKPKDNADNLYSFRELSRDVQAIFDRYATTDNYLVGHSYGGALAACQAIKEPNRVKKLILITPVALKPYRVPAFFFLPTALLELTRPLLRQYADKLNFFAETDPSIIAYQGELFKKNHMYVLKPLAFGMKKIPAIEVAGIKQPTLILTVNNDWLTPESRVRLGYQTIPKVEFQTVSRAGHMVIMEQAQEVSRKIMQFLENSP